MSEPALLIPNAPPELRLVPPPEEIVVTDDELWQMAKFRGVMATLVAACGSSLHSDVEAHVGALMAAHAELPALRARVADFEAAERAGKLAAMFDGAEKASKLTPAIKQQVQAAFDAGDVTLKGAESWLASLLPLKALQAKSEGLPSGLKATGQGTKHAWNGKQYSELTGLERVQLHKEDPELYELMRQESFQ